MKRNMTLGKVVLTLTGFIISLYTSIIHGSPLKKDETVMFFPVSAAEDSAGKWSVPIHHWVFEKEERAVSQKLIQEIFSEAFEGVGVSEEQANSKLMKQRSKWFLVDNERHKLISINLNGDINKLNLTKPNGHSITDLSFNKKNLQAGDWFSVKAEDKFNREFVGDVQLIPEMGLSVISDIDDTIKISNVLDKKELIINTFIEPYQITKSFPEYYQRLENTGAYFHYVSASPWQLYPSLKPFMDLHYPRGTISLRDFRLTDSSLIKFLKPSTVYKTEKITSIIKRYPKHEFILIGDSGEHDPEVYAEIYSLFPANIKSIHIRAVEGSDLRDKRFTEIFKQVPESIWKIVGEYPLNQ